MPVTGIGGVFFRSENPKRLIEWYEKHFGIMSADHSPWNQSAGPTVFMPFPNETDYFSREKQWMINLRVEGLDAIISTLQSSGIAVVTKAEWNSPETGRFARLHDPEGNAIELWEPPGA